MRVRVICSLRLLNCLVPVETSGLGIRPDRDLAMYRPPPTATAVGSDVSGAEAARSARRGSRVFCSDATGSRPRVDSVVGSISDEQTIFAHPEVAQCEEECASRHLQLPLVAVPVDRDGHEHRAGTGGARTGGSASGCPAVRWNGTVRGARSRRCDGCPYPLRTETTMAVSTADARRRLLHPPQRVGRR